MTSPLGTAPCTVLLTKCPLPLKHTLTHCVVAMARSRSSGGGAAGVCSWLAAALALWSMVSVVVIMVWATWAGAGQCEARWRLLLENMEGARLVWERETHTAERERQLSTDTQTQLQEEIHNITHTITHTNQMLTHQLHMQAVLRENLTALQNEVQQHKHAVDKLTTEHTHNTALMEELQVNLWSEQHLLDSCSSLCDAARSRYTAAERQRKACEIHTKYLHTQREKCELGV